MRWGIGDDYRAGVASYFFLATDKNGYDQSGNVLSGDVLGVSRAGSDSGAVDGPAWTFNLGGFNVSGGEYNAGHEYQFGMQSKRTSGTGRRTAWFKPVTNQTGLASGGVDIATSGAIDGLRIYPLVGTSVRSSIILGKLDGSLTDWAIGKDLPNNGLNTFSIRDYERSKYVFYADATGVGINNSAPTQALDVTGDIQAEKTQDATTSVRSKNISTGTSAAAGFYASAGTPDVGLNVYGTNYSGGGGIYAGNAMLSTSGNTDLMLGVSGARVMRMIHGSYNIAIRKDTAASELDVNGTVTATNFSGPLTGNASTATLASGVVDNAITPDDVLSTGQTDELCLTYEATGDTWEWQSCGSGSVDDTAYNATTWDGVTTTAPSKNAVRDKFETTQPLDADLTAIASLACADGEPLEKTGGVWACGTDGGGGGGIVTVEEDNVTVTTSATNLDFLGADFDVTGATGESDVNIASAITRDSEWNTGIDFLVGTATGSITGEIAVGTTPGGELGNTWASPTLDDGVTVATWTLTSATITDPTLDIKNSAAPAPTAEGQIEWEDDDDHLIVGDGAAQVEFVPAEDVTGDATMTDAGDLQIASGVISSSDIANGTIVDADINASAAIDGTKINPASATVPGVVTTGAQTFVGLKTFNSGIAMPAGQTLAITSGCTIGTDVDCPASSTSGGSLQLKEDSDLGTSKFIMTLGASNLSTDVTCTIDASGRIPDSCVGDGTDGGGGGTPNILDIGDDGGNDSIDLIEIATTGDTNNIFTESAADKLLIAVGNDWPKADTADDLTCTDCIGPTEITGLTAADLAANIIGAGQIDYTADVAADPALGAKQCVFSSVGTHGGIVCEGTSANAFETTLQIVAPISTGDLTITMPTITGGGSLSIPATQNNQTWAGTQTFSATPTLTLGATITDTAGTCANPASGGTTICTKAGKAYIRDTGGPDFELATKIDVSSYATGGTGTSGDPWTSPTSTGGFQEALDACPAGPCKLYAKAGYYLFKDRNGNNADCIGAGNPSACCTGAGTGTCACIATEGSYAGMVTDCGMLINRSNVTITGDGPEQTILVSSLVATTGLSFPASVIRTYPTHTTETTVTADIAQGATSITVTSSTGFASGDKVKIAMVGTQHASELNVVDTVPDGTHVTLKYPVKLNYDKDAPNTTYFQEIAFVENLIIERMGFHGNAGLDDRATHIKDAINATIQDNYAQDFGSGGFGFDNGVQGGLIFHNTVKNIAPAGGAVYFGALIAEADRGVSIRDNYVYNMGANASCIYATTTSELVIEGNRCINASSTGGGFGVHLFGGARDVVISNNFFYRYARGMSVGDECHDAGTCTIATRAPNTSGRITIQNNTWDSIGNSTGAGGIHGFKFGETTHESKITDVNIVGNRFINTKFDNLFYFAYGSDRVRFINNQFLENDNSSGGSQFVYFDGKNGGHNDVVFDGNLFRHSSNAFGSGSSSSMTALFLAQATADTTAYKRWRVTNNRFEMTLGTSDPLSVSGTNTTTFGLGNQMYGNTVANRNECTASTVPYPCCTGSGTGTCPYEYNLEQVRNASTDTTQWNGLSSTGARVTIGTELMQYNSSNPDKPSYCVESYLTDDPCIVWDQNFDGDANYTEGHAANDAAWVLNRDLKTTQIVQTDCGNVASGTTISADHCSMLTLTGTTQVDTINTCASHLKTRTLTILCGTSTAAFGDLAGNIDTAGSQACSTGETYTFVCDGTKWIQISNGAASPSLDGTNFTGIPSSAITTEVRSMYWGAGSLEADGTECSSPATVTVTSGPKLQTISCPMTTSETDGFIYGSTVLPDSIDIASDVTMEITTRVVTDGGAGTWQGYIEIQCVPADGTVGSTWSSGVDLDVTEAAGDVVDDLLQDTSAAVDLAQGANPDCAGGDVLFWRWKSCDTDATPSTGCTSSAGFENDFQVVGFKMEYTTTVGD
jgi:hypothetical protein